MRWIRFLLIFAAAIAIVVGGAIAFLLTADLDDYKHHVEAAVQNLTGRTLELKGRVDLRLGTRASLEIIDARFGNPPWASNPDMARVGRAKVAINLRTLLRGPLLVELIELEDAELHLEALEDGRNNWTFGDVDRAAPPVDETDEVDRVIPLVLRHANGRDVLFTLTLPTLPRTLVVDADRVTQEQLPDGMLRARIEGRLNDRDVTVGGTYGTLSNLLRARNLRYDIDGTLDNLMISSNGLIDDLARPRRPEIDLAVTAPNLDAIAETIEIPDVGEGGLNLTAIVRSDPDDVFAEVRGNVGEYTIDTKLRVADLRSWERFTLDTSFNGPGLNTILADRGIDNVPDGPFETTGRIVRDGNRIEIEDATLSLGKAVLTANGTVNDIVNLDDSRLQLRARGEHIERFRALLGLPGAAVGPFQLRADLNVQPDGAELLDIHLRTNITTLSVSGAIVGRSPAFVGTKLAFEGTGENFADFGEVLRIPDPISAPFTIKGAIELGDQQLRSTEQAIVDVGANRLTLAGTIGYQPLERDTDVDLSASGPDLAKLLAMVGIAESVPSLPFDVSAALAVAPDGYRIGDLRAELGTSLFTLDGVISKAESLTGSQVTFTAAGPRLGDLFIDASVLDVGQDLGDEPFDVAGSAELLADALRLRDIRLELVGAEASLDADIGLPIESGSGHFALDASGPNLSAILPVQSRWRPPAAPFEVHAQGRLLEHPPGGEVERVDVDRDPGPGDPHVLAPEARRAPELEPLPVGEERALAELAGERRVRSQRPRRPVDVELGVAARRAAVPGTQLDQLFALLVQGGREVLQGLAALREAQPAQGGPPHLAGVAHGAGEVQARGAGPGDVLTGHGVLQEGRGAVSGLPAAKEVALEGLHRAVREESCAGDRARQDSPGRGGAAGPERPFCPGARPGCVPPRGCSRRAPPAGARGRGFRAAP